MTYLSRRALIGLREYRYKPAGYTILDDWHQPIWNFITNNILPNWLAPNLITLTGLMALIVAYCTSAVYLPDFRGLAPDWLPFASGSAVLFYLHMDALDGKQARKTKTSSPLGQLFDHGCDALAVHLVLVPMISSLQLHHEWRAVVGLLYVFVPWWVAHWEEYHTGVMLYGNGLWGVTEANYAVVFLHYYTYILGPKGWTFRPIAALLDLADARKLLPFPDSVIELVAGFKVNDLLLISFGCMGASLLFEQILRVFRLAGTHQVSRTTMPPAEQGNKTLGRRAAFWHLTQIFGTCACGGLLLALPITSSYQSRILFATFGFTYAMQATRQIGRAHV